MVVRRDECIVANLHLIEPTGAVVTNDVFAGHISIGESALRAGHIRALDVNRHLVVIRAHFAFALKLAMNQGVDLDSFAVGRRNDQGILWTVTISLGECLQTFLIWDFNYLVSAFQIVNCFADLPG